MSASVSALAAIKRIQALPAAVTAGTKLGLVAGVEILRKAADAEINHVAPGGRLRGVGQHGATVTAKAEVVGNVGRVFVGGPEHLIERDTKAHPIKPRRALALRLPGDEWRASSQSKGTKGKHPFEKGVIAAVPAATAAVKGATDKALAKVIGSL